MGFERRRNKAYYYRKRRKGNHVVSEYIGQGELAEGWAHLDRLERERSKLMRIRDRIEIDSMKETDAEIDKACNQIQAIVQASLLAAGYHTHKGQWRKKRNG